MKKVSQITAHPVRQLQSEYSPPEPGTEARRLPCEEMSTDDKFSADESIPGFDNMDMRSQEAITRSLTNAKTEKRRLAKKHKQEGGGN